MKDPDWLRHSYGESPKSVGRREEPMVRPKKFAVHKIHMVLYMKCRLGCNIQKVLVYKQKSFVLKMIIGCNPSMTGFSHIRIVLCGGSR